MRKTRYLELSNAVAESIQRGDLAPGTRLPTHRMFAEQHGIALATATRAYQDLERRGLIVGEAGRGMFVRDLGLPITLGLEQAVTDDLIDLVFNMPGDSTDSELLRSSLKRLAVAGDLEAMLRYQPHGGRPHERRIITSYLNKSLFSVKPEQLLITSGGQHGLAITAFGLLRRGDTIAVDLLTYPGFKAVAALHGLNLVPIKEIDGTMDSNDLELKCKEHKLNAVYLMPTVHNPLGTVMDESTRLSIVKIAKEYGLLIIEDSAYAFLEPDPPPNFATIFPENTIHIGSFSKNLATGLRLGYLIAPKQYLERLIHAIRATTWNVPALISALVIGWIEDGTIKSLEKKRRLEGAKHQRICKTILKGVLIQSHKNASFAWLPITSGQRAESIVSQLAADGIAVSAAGPFTVADAIPQALRLAFGGIPKHELKNSIQKIRDVLTN